MLSIVVVYIMTIASTTSYLHTASSPHSLNPKVGLSVEEIYLLNKKILMTISNSITLMAMVLIEYRRKRWKKAEYNISGRNHRKLIIIGKINLVSITPSVPK